MTEQAPAVDPIITPPKKPRVRLPRPSARRWGMNPEDRLRVMEAVYVVPAQGWIVHFGLMMLMSVIVAIMGLSANSPALVIGAMLIAPLMTPVLGIAASISMALGDALARAVTTVVLATVGAIFIGWLLAGWLPQPLLTGEVLARTAPDLRDLVVALAAGVAGSYATAKPDVSSSLPGVAIAVALVPPLAVVGICLRAGRSELASGALLLYGTNLAAIITVSTIVFVIAGFVPGRRLASMAPRVLAGGFVAFVVVALLGILLATRSIDASNSARDVAAVRDATDTWLSGTFNESDVELDGSVVRVRVIGPTEPPDTTEYRAQLEQELGEPAELEISWIQGQTSESIELTTSAARAIEQTTLVPDAVGAWLNDAGGDDVFKLSDLTYSRDEISFVITSLVAPPSAQDLHASLEAEIGVAPVPVITWRDLSAEALAADLASIDQIESAARDATEEWALPLDIDVDEVSFDGTRLSIDIAGIVRPEGTDLERVLAEIVGTETEIDVGFLQRSSVIPAPTATPTPLPTATPVPTPVPSATPVPTPDVTPTPG